MASPPYISYHGPPFLGDDLVYHSQAFARADSRTINCSIDPGLQWVTERYLEDSLQKTYFHTDVQTMPTNSTFMTTDGISAVPQPFQPRLSSPMSSIELSSSSESIRSPLADTELIPITPPDTSSYHHVASYEHWETHNSRFMGMRDPIVSRSSADNYVNPTDVNSIEQADYNDSEINIDFACLSQGGFSHETFTSQCENEPTETTISLDSGFRRMTSPEAMQPHVEDEISASSQYPPPPPHTSSEDDIEDDIEDEVKPVPLVIRKRKEVGDDDYRPTKTNTRTTTRRGQQVKQTPVASNRTSADSPAAKRAKTSHVNSSSRSTGQHQKPKALPPSTSGAKAAFTCADCQYLPFKDQETLDYHIKKTHTRPFICVFNFAGCDSTFASKNEWKRHVSSQHLLLNYWLCQESSCGKNVNHDNSASSHSPSSKGASSKARPRTSSSSSSNAVSSSPAGTTPSLPNGVIFNRKDLYTQHLRRMHMPPQVKKTLKQAASKKSGSSSSAAAATAGQNATAAPPSAVEWEERMRACQKRACKQRCHLPDTMLCPAVGCAVEFRGADAWDQRMEHVARHLEKAAAEREPPVVFGGQGDPSLVHWASSDQVAIIKRAAGDEGREWVLNTPLKRGAGGGPGGIVIVASSSSAAPAVPAAAASDDERGAAVKSEIVVTEQGSAPVVGSEDDEDMDAEGEDDDI
ncbi:hypothetical protein B0T19DRAFT_174508 [Cercophora scortea]|uniref:C2H2-type domain-containing protein n=1 Tax=Cercophora scortea TaxID=314031 RepID=A0AAE0IMD8_9PEZI|nr:hypothetical protein B0T19DRAFT_174508 [Cercophora scortea]